MLALHGSCHALSVGPGQTVHAPSCGSTFSLSLNGGTLVGGGCAVSILDAALSGGVLTTGELRFGIADLTGTVSVRSGLSVPTVVADHTWTQSGNGALEIWFAGSLVNLGTYRLANDLGITLVNPAYDLAGKPRIENRKGALFVKSVPAGGSANPAGLSSISVPFYNSGTVRAEVGTLWLSGGGAHSDAVFEAAGGRLSLTGDHLFSKAVLLSAGGAASGAVDVNGLTVDTAATVDNRVSLTVYNGASPTAESLVNRGTITSTGAGRVTGVNANIRNEGVLDGSLSLSNQSHLVNSGTVKFAGAGGGFASDSRITNAVGGKVLITPTGGFGMDATASVQNSGLWSVDGRFGHDGSFDNLAPGQVVVNGSWSGQNGGAAVTNAGSFTIAAGATFQAASYVQTAGKLVVNGGFNTDPGVTTQILGGELRGSGQINGDVFVGGTAETAQFKPGNSPGHFTINGMLTMAAGSALELQVERGADGSLAWDQVSAQSIQFLPGSSLHFVIGAGVATTAGQRLDGFLDCGFDPWACSLDSATRVVIDGAPEGSSYSFSPFTGLSLDIAAAAPPVPEPAPWLLLASGLGWLASRRRASAVVTARRRIG